MKIQIHFPWGIYKKLSNDNKVQFWAITSSCFVAIFTFFIGLTYQYLVLDESKEENRWSQHTQFVDNMSPVLKQRRSFENFSYMCSNQVNRAEKQLKQIQNSNTLNNSLMSNQTSNTHTLLKNLNTLADTIYSFSKDLYQVIDIPKYYMYDNLRDSVIQQQDALELHIKTFEILNYLLKNKNLNREELAMQLEEVISFPATLEDKLNDVLNKYSNSSYLDVTIAKLQLSQEMCEIIRSINEVFKEETFPSFTKTNPNQSINNIFTVGIILFILGILVWLILINITFGVKKNSANPLSSIDYRRKLDEINEIITEYNSNDLINDEDFITDPLIIYKRLYNKWNNLRMELNALKANRTE